jgi:ATP-dependent helicase/nuclease subunit A
MTFETNTVVWASAGTGKTRKLVEVYLELLARGLDPTRIVAMTFTERAAAEMRDRIRTALEMKPGEWARVMSILPGAPISTIHAFCGILLRDNGFHLGIDPGFSMLDEQQSLDLARESARQIIRQEIRGGSDDAAAIFRDFGLSGLVNTLVSLGSWLNSLGHDAGWLDARVDDQRRLAGDIEKRIAEDIRKYGGTAERIGELADELDARKAKHPLRKRDDAQALLPQIGQIAGVETAERLCKMGILFLNWFRARKRAANVMDFDDLLLGARNLLKDDANIRRHYQNHFQGILVDEFQDTDEVQAEIISLLAEDPQSPGRFAPGKLMIVGDPKQSIYRFRRARVTVFFRMLQRIMDEGGSFEHLQDNYRSAAPIAEFSNRLSEVMMDGAGKIASIAGSDLDLSYRIKFSDADVLKPKSAAPFLGITYLASEFSVRAGEGREMEAEAIARLLRQWKASGEVESWNKVAILMRAMTNVEIYLRALELHGIPVYVVQGTAFYQKTEVSDLIAFLELVLHPDDELLRTTVMTSALFGVTFDEVVKRGLTVIGPPPVTTNRMNTLLDYWVERRDKATAAEILQDVIRQTNFDVVMLAQKDGPQRSANIGKLIEITRQLARQGTAGLDEVVGYLRDRAGDPAVRESEAQIVSQEDDVVRLLTVHQAKGLEFDIVILPDLAARAGRDSGDRTLFSDRWGVLAGASYGLHRKPLPHSLILEAKQLEEDQQYEEEKRLLYVAVTRARSMLVLGEGFSKQTGPWLQWMEKLFESAQPGALGKARDGKQQFVDFTRSASPIGPSLNQGFSIKVLPASQLNVPEQLSFSGDAVLVGEPEFPAVRQPRVQAGVDMTPSDLTTLDGCFRYFHSTRILGLVEPGHEPPDDSAQMRLGSIAHKLLQNSMSPDHDELVSAGVPDLELVFQSADWRNLASAMPEREMPFMIHLAIDGQDCWVRGRMDATVTGGVPRVIDYKYVTWRRGAESRYDMQMMVYSLALMKALDTDRAIGELWYVRSPMKIVRREYMRLEAEDRLTALLKKYIAALDSDEWPRADRSYCDQVECGFRSQCWSPS